MPSIDDINNLLLESIKDRKNSDNNLKNSIKQNTNDILVENIKLESLISKENNSRDEKDIQINKKLIELSNIRKEQTNNLSNRLNVLEKLVFGEEKVFQANKIDVDKKIADDKKIAANKRNILTKRKNVINVSQNTLNIKNKNLIFTLMKVDNGKQIVLECYDNNMKMITQKEYMTFVNLRNREIYRYGKIHPCLGEKLNSIKDNNELKIKIWTLEQNQDLDLDYNKKIIFSESFEKYHRANRHLNKPGQDNFNLIFNNFIKTEQGNKYYNNLLKINSNLKIYEVVLTKEEIIKISRVKNVVGIFLKDDSFNLDIKDMKDDTNATTIVDSEGWKGTNIRVCVFEGSPGNDDGMTGFNEVNNNIDPDGQRSGIQIVYDSSIFPDDSDHAVSVTAIITNRASKVNEQGYAPDSLIYSANDYTLDSLVWGVQNKECRIVNQSFHRDNEWNSMTPTEDDLFKDLLVLSYPFPFITTASGNWSQNSSDEPGGIDGSLEYVNHKSYNCVTVGNANDFIGDSPRGMVGSSVWKNPISNHGDWELPELCANGNSVKYNGQNRGGGTSYASPAVAGTAALLQNADNLLLNWPEGIRAILFAGAITNIKDDNWYKNIVDGIDGYDGCGCIDTKESMRITVKSFKSGKTSPNNNPKPRGWDVGVLSDNLFKKSNAYLSYFIGVPNIDPTGNRSKKCNIKVALTWNSKITSLYIIKSELTLDYDLYIYNEKGQRVSYSASWDNSYEVIDFEGNRGEIYEIRIKRFSGTGNIWYGLAWTSGDGTFYRLTKVIQDNIFRNYAVSDIIDNNNILLEYGLRDISNIDILWSNTLQNNNYIIDYENIFRLASKVSTNVKIKFNFMKLDKYLRSSMKEIILLKLDIKTLKWIPIKFSKIKDIFEFYLNKIDIFTFGIKDSNNSSLIQIKNTDDLCGLFLIKNTSGSTINYGNTQLTTINYGTTQLTTINKEWFAIRSNITDIQFKGYKFRDNIIKVFYGRKKKDNTSNYDDAICYVETDNLEKINVCFYFDGKFYIPESKNRKLLKYYTGEPTGNEFVSGRLSVIYYNNQVKLTHESSKHDINYLLKKKKEWVDKNISNYTFNFKCSYIGDNKVNDLVKIFVKNDKISSIINLKDNSIISNTSDYFTLTELFDKISKWFDSYVCNLEININKEYGYVDSYYVKILNSENTDSSFKVSNFVKIDNILDLPNNFYIKNESKYIAIQNKNIEINVVSSTKDLPPSYIDLSYLNCVVRYKRNRENNIKYGFIYNKYMYSPIIENNYMLRYSENGIVTEDYISCRITLYGSKYKYPYTFSVENNLDPVNFNRDLFYEIFRDNLDKFSKFNFKNYSFYFNWDCYCIPEYTQTVQIIVNNDKITNVIKVNNINSKDTNIIKDPIDKDIYYTLYGLFKYVDKTVSDVEFPYKVSVKYNKQYGFIEKFYIDKNKNITDEEIGFTITNFAISDGFFVKENNIIKLAKTTDTFKVVPITKDFPPSRILIEYSDCKVNFKIDDKTTVGYLFDKHTYVPENKKLLRYSESGIVTMDFIICRITIIKENDEYILTIQK